MVVKSVGLIHSIGGIRPTCETNHAEGTFSKGWILKSQKIEQFWNSNILSSHFVVLDKGLPTEQRLKITFSLSFLIISVLSIFNKHHDSLQSGF